MKKYIIKETCPSVTVWTYEVMAETEQEAYDKVMENKYDTVNYEILNDEDGITMDIEEAKE
jgi:hypothetical protein